MFMFVVQSFSEVNPEKSRVDVTEPDGTHFYSKTGSCACVGRRSLWHDKKTEKSCNSSLT